MSLQGDDDGGGGVDGSLGAKQGLGDWTSIFFSKLRSRFVFRMNEIFCSKLYSVYFAV